MKTIAIQKKKQTIAKESGRSKVLARGSHSHYEIEFDFRMERDLNIKSTTTTTTIERKQTKHRQLN